jgi:transposase-like protein
MMNQTNQQAERTDGLPSAHTRRWVVRRKAAVVAAVRQGQLTLTDVAERYGLSEEEFRLWEQAFDANGVPGLRVTRIQIYKDYPTICVPKGVAET